MVILKRAAVCGLLAGAAVLTGCSSASFSTDKIDYKSVAPPNALEIPPDLTQLPKDDRYAVPNQPGVASASAAVAPERAAQVVAEPVRAVVPTSPNAHIERDGSQRWLAVDVPPEKAFEVVKEFWPTVGLTVERADPATGIVETNWAENRAKLPQDIIRSTLGSALGSLYSTGEQDKFRARIERTPNNTSEIYISHRGMKEVVVGDMQGTVWQPRPSDPQLEAEMLQRLAMRFAPRAPTAAAAAKPQVAPGTAAASVTMPAAPPPVARLVSGADGKAVRVDVDEPFDRAWRRVGLALDRGGFTVEDRDRNKGTYFVRYLDPDYEAKMREGQGFFSRIFGKDPKISAQQFRVLLSTDLTPTQVSVLDKDGKPDTGTTAQKILGLLADQLK